MIRFIQSLLGIQHATEAKAFTRGDRVRKIDDELIGTLSGFVLREGIDHARIVYCGARATWVELVDAGLLRPA